MKAIYFTRFIAKYSLICVLMTGGTQAQALGKDKFCYEVYDYVYSDPMRNSYQNFTLRDQSFYLLLKLANSLKHLPLHVNFLEDQVIYYFWEPCSKTKEGFAQLIITHNYEFGEKIKLVPSQNYKKEDIECIFSEKFQLSCPGGYVEFNKEKAPLND